LFPASPVSIAIIGSGFGALGAAIRLKREGVDDFVILDAPAIPLAQPNAEVGSNTGLGHNSVVQMIEAPLQHIVAVLRHRRPRRTLSDSLPRRRQPRAQRGLSTRAGASVSGCARRRGRRMGLGSGAT
jgi:hypothetical protein